LPLQDHCLVANVVAQHWLWPAQMKGKFYTPT
jgi:hypothetical protein